MAHLHDLPGGLGAGARNMRELVEQMRVIGDDARALLDDPASSVLDDRPPGGRQPRRRRPSHRELRRAARGEPDPLDRQRDGGRRDPGGVEGLRRDQQDPRQRDADPGGRPLRAHRRHALPQPGLHDQAARRRSARRDRGRPRGRQRLGIARARTTRKRPSSASRPPRYRAPSTSRWAACASCAWGPTTSGPSASATSFSGAPPSPCAACWGSCASTRADKGAEPRFAAPRPGAGYLDPKCRGRLHWSRFGRRPAVLQQDPRCPVFDFVSAPSDATNRGNA